VHLRQPFQLSRSLTPAHYGGELLHVGKCFANGGETTLEAGTFDLGLGNPLEAALVVVAFEFEFLHEHRIVSRLNKDPSVRLTSAS
jgi:hypothetical protein